MSPNIALFGYIEFIALRCYVDILIILILFNFSILFEVDTINIAHYLQVILYYAHFLYTDRKYSIWLCDICIFSGEDLTGGEIAGIAVGMSDLLPPRQQRAQACQCFFFF